MDTIELICTADDLIARKKHAGDRKPWFDTLQEIRTLPVYVEVEPSRWEQLKRFLTGCPATMLIMVSSFASLVVGILLR